MEPEVFYFTAFLINFVLLVERFSWQKKNCRKILGNSQYRWEKQIRLKQNIFSAHVINQIELTNRNMFPI